MVREWHGQLRPSSSSLAYLARGLVLEALAVEQVTHLAPLLGAQPG
jgi:hypothetical protein